MTRERIRIAGPILVMLAIGIWRFRSEATVIHRHLSAMDMPQKSLRIRCRLRDQFLRKH